MKKFLTFLFAIALVALPLMAQNEYPKYIDSGIGYEVDGVLRSSVNTTMLRMVIDAEAAAYAGKLDVVADRWYSNISSYDTIARMHFENHVALSKDTTRLSSDEYKNVRWSVYWNLDEVAPNDTVKTLHFYYEGTIFLSFNMEVDTSYTAYAGRPYRILEAYNPLMVPLTYTSENQNVGTVDERGFITVAGKGESMITATYPGDKRLGIDSLSASWKLVVKEGDYFAMQVMALERTEHPWGGGGTYLGFDMVKVTSENCNDILGDGKLSFDIATRTLTMNNFQKIFTEEEDNSMGWMDWLDYYSGPLPLNIRVIGNCAIKNNSAGIFGGWELYLTGDANSSLTLDGRFPQLNAESKITIDGTKVYVTGDTPHPLMACETLAVQDNSYLDVKLEIEAAPGEDPRQWGAMAVVLGDLELGEHTGILTEGVHVADGTFVQSDGLTALHVEIGPKDKQALENLPVVDKAQKVLHNGQILILRADHIYTIQGQVVR